MLGPGEKFEQHHWEGTEPGGGQQSARHFLNLWFRAVRLQAARATAPVSEPTPSTLPDVMAQVEVLEVDTEFFLVALRRLWRCASYLVPDVLSEPDNQLVEAVATFEAAVPDLANLRNAAEHFDDHARGKGRALEPGEPFYGGFVAGFGADADRWMYLGERRVSVREALAAAEALYVAADRALAGA